MPKTLRQLIRGTSRNGLDLGIRFQLARKLIDALHLMHSANWLHKNIRSDVILFFPAKEKIGDIYRPSTSNPQRLAYDEPIFVGFNNSRLEITPTTIDREVSIQSRNITLDFYQHPEKRHNTKILYCREYDLYSLGCVLLEIGLWQTLDDCLPHEFSSSIDKQKMAIRNLARQLDKSAGSIYTRVVKNCLDITRDPSPKAALTFERNIAVELSQCVA